MTYPQRKTSTIVDEINAAIEQNQWSRFLSARFSAEAKKIRAVSISDGDMLLGIIAAQENDLDEAHRRFKNALHHPGDHSAVRENYANAIKQHGFFSEAVQILSPIADQKHAARQLALCFLGMGMQEKAKQFFLASGGKKEHFELFCSTALQTKPGSPDDMAALNAVYESFEKDKAIWQSLSMR